MIPQLVRVADDTNIWAETYDENMTEVFRVQSDIAERVATQLDVALLEPERRAIEKRPTENLAAYEALPARDGTLLELEELVRRGAFSSVLSESRLTGPPIRRGLGGLSMAYHATLLGL